MDGFKMFYFILELDKVFSLPRPLWPQKSWQLRSRVQPKRKIFHQIDLIIVIMIIMITLALDKDGILLQDVPSQASAVLVPISASHTGFT